jgi:hypothetical protein
MVVLVGVIRMSSTAAIISKVGSRLGMLRIGAACLVFVVFFVVPPIMYYWNTLVPPTLPSYEHASQVQVNNRADEQDMSFDTKDSFETVLSFFDGAFKKAGLTKYLNVPRGGPATYIRGDASKPYFCAMVDSAGLEWESDGANRLVAVQHVKVSLLKGACPFKFILDEVCGGGSEPCTP